MSSAVSSAAIADRNRANAAHSTGPRTPEGRAISAQNALKMGLSIQRHVVLEHEDPAAFIELHAELMRIYAPQSEREQLAIQEVAHCRWAFRRFDEAEILTLTCPISMEGSGEMFSGSKKLLCMAALPTSDGEAQPEWKALHNLCRYRGHWERRHQRALAEFDRAQAARYREARTRLAEERARMAEECHQMVCERHERAMARAAAQPPSIPPRQKPNETKDISPSGFVPHSDITSQERGIKPNKDGRVGVRI